MGEAMLRCRDSRKDFKRVLLISARAGFPKLGYADPWGSGATAQGVRSDDIGYIVCVTVHLSLKSEHRFVL